MRPLSFGSVSGPSCGRWTCSRLLLAALVCVVVFCQARTQNLEKQLASLRTEDARGAVAAAAVSLEGNPFEPMVEHPVSELKLDPSALESEARLC